MSRFNHKAASQQSRRKPYAALNFLNSLIVPGDYAGFWDIVQPGGALDRDGLPCTVDGAQVFRLPQLLPDGTATDVTFRDPAHFNSVDPAEWSTLTLRRGIRLIANRYSTPRVPFLYYPKGVMAAAAADGEISTDEMPAVLRLGNGNLGTPPGWTPTVGWSYGFFGCKTTTEMGSFGEALGDLGDMSFNQYPAPIRPGTVIFNAIIENDNIVTTTYVNGVPVQVETVAIASSTLDDDGLAGTFMLIGLFCWAVQKYFVISKPLTLSEIDELHLAFVGTMESFA